MNSLSDLEVLLGELQKARASIELIHKFCKYQTIFAQNVFTFCRQKNNRAYAWNLGSAGGPVISCKGAPAPTIGSHKEIRDGKEVIVVDYAEQPPPCPYFIEKGAIIGWKIILPNKKEAKHFNKKARSS